MASSGKVTRTPEAGSPLVRAQLQLGAYFDQLANPTRIHVLEQRIVLLAILGFLLHLGLIWVCTALPALEPLAKVVGTNYLSAIYTPFSFILFYELLLLVLSIPESTTLALGRQFEIISLITVRNVFKDLAEFKSLDQIETQTGPVTKVLIDLATGVLLFLLVAIFYHINRWRAAPERGRHNHESALTLFIAQKKVIALALSALFFVLLGASLWAWGSAIWVALTADGPMPRTLTTIFYTDIFSVLVFADVLLLLLSLLISNSYPLVFRNAGFVASTILLRLALAAAWPYNLLASLAAVGFGIIVNAVYLYSTRVVVAPDDSRA